MLIRSLAVFLFALVLPIFAAKSSKSDAERIDKFTGLAKKNGGYIPLNDQLYDEILSGDRSYSVSILLTALAPQFQCVPCREIDPEYKLLARSWLNQNKGKRLTENDEVHFFGVLDFNDGHEVYRRLNLQNAPTFHYWPPTTGPRATKENLKGPQIYDITRNVFKAEPIAHFLSQPGRVTTLRFERPPDYLKLASLVAMTLATIAMVVIAWDNFKLILGNRWLWAIGVTSTILLMISGHMWNQIRHPPYVRSQNGQVQYIAGGYSNQNGVETHIVSFMYGALAFAAYTLTIILPRIGDGVKQRIGIYLWIGVFTVMFGVLVQLFRVKNPAYPFKILF